MSKRRRKSTPKPREVFEWSAKEAAATLAYIDDCIEMGKTRIFMEDTVADHLKSNWSRDFTWIRVENRLRIIHRRAHKPEYKSRGCIASMGTACLDLENLEMYFLPHELTLEDIRAAKAELKVRSALNDKREIDVTAIRVSSRLSATPGYLESRCSAANSPVHRACSRGTRTARGTSTRSPDSNQSILPKLAKRNPAARANFISKNSRWRNPTGQTAAIDSTEIPDSGDASQNESTSRDMSEIFQQGSDIKTENFPSFAAPQASASATFGQIDSVDCNVTEEAGHLFSETTDRLMNHQAIIDDLKATNFMLKNQLAASEKELKYLRTIWDKSTKQEPDKRAISDCRRQLNRAIDENTNLKAILKFRSAEDAGVVLTGPEKSHIQNELDYITNRSKMTFDFNQYLAFEIPHHISNSETESLLRIVVSGEQASNSDMLLSLTAAKELKPLNLVRAMTSSALRHWIFESDWPRFDHSCIKLNGYRELISLKEGVQFAQDFDFAVDRLLIETPTFNDDLSERVSELSDRLVRALAPFFVPNLLQGNLSDQLSIEVAEIKDFVLRALKLKLDLLNSPYSYSLVTIQSGSAFDPSVMRIETENGIPVDGPTKHPAIVKLCVSPALFQSLHRHGASEKGQSQNIEFREASFGCNNFVQEISGGRDLVTQAVVLLQE